MNLAWEGLMAIITLWGGGFFGMGAMNARDKKMMQVYIFFSAVTTLAGISFLLDALKLI